MTGSFGFRVSVGAVPYGRRMRKDPPTSARPHEEPRVRTSARTVPEVSTKPHIRMPGGGVVEVISVDANVIIGEAVADLRDGERSVLLRAIDAGAAVAVMSE